MRRLVTAPDGSLGLKDGATATAAAHHPDALDARDAQSVADRLKAGRWVSRAEMVKVSKAHRLSMAALIGAVSRGWELAADCERRGETETSDKLRDWCRTMRRALPESAAPLPAMPAPEPLHGPP